MHIIRNSYDNAKQNLMDRFGLDDIQAQAICDMRLIAAPGPGTGRSWRLSTRIWKRRSHITKSCSDPEKDQGGVSGELLEIRDKYGDERKTEIEDVEDIDDEDLIEGGGLRLHPSPPAATSNGWRPRNTTPSAGRQGRARHGHP